MLRALDFTAPGRRAISAALGSSRWIPCGTRRGPRRTTIQIQKHLNKTETKVPRRYSYLQPQVKAKVEAASPQMPVPPSAMPAMKKRRGNANTHIAKTSPHTIAYPPVGVDFMFDRHQVHMLLTQACAPCKKILPGHYHGQLSANRRPSLAMQM